MRTMQKMGRIGALLVVVGVAVAGLAWSSVHWESTAESVNDARAGDVNSLAQAVEPAAANQGAQRAIAVLHPTAGNEVQGVVTFTAVDGGIRVVADIENLTPGSHGFHIHEFGDCSAPDASSTGEHFNPELESHGAPASEARHVGDLGNIQVDEHGHGHYDWTDMVISFEGSHSVIGRSVVISADADDFLSQPDGATGARIACGVIGIAAAE